MMAASGLLIRNSLIRTLFAFHRCFVSAAYLQCAEYTSTGSETISAAGKKPTQDVTKEGNSAANASTASMGEDTSGISATDNDVKVNINDAQEVKTSSQGSTDSGRTTGSEAQEFGAQQEQGMSEADIFLGSALEDDDGKRTHYEERGEYDSDEYYDTEDEVRIKILDAALNHVSIYGWSSDAIAAGAEDVGLSSVAEGMFKKGGGDLALHFIENCNIDLAEYLASNSRLKESQGSAGEQTSDLRVFLRDALKKRLAPYGPHINMGTWPQAMGLLMLPQNAPSALENAAHMVDEIWYHAGDTSTDVDWYMKRGVLGAVYGATELYMLRDRSEGFQDTWEFLDRRLQDIHNAAEVKAKVEQCASDTAQMASMAVSVARNLIGLNSRNR